MISKYEATGIFASAAIMALVLAFIRFDGVNGIAVFDHSNKGQAAAAIVSTQGKAAPVSEAIAEASAGGELEKLVIDDVRIGTEGRAVRVGDTVTVHYVGTTRDGVRFDSSYERNKPFTFTVGDAKVIEGWEEGIPGMKVGGTRILVIPPHLAYGNAQVGPIPPNSILVFSVELLAIE